MALVSAAHVTYTLHSSHVTKFDVLRVLSKDRHVTKCNVTPRILKELRKGTGVFSTLILSCSFNSFFRS